MRFSFIRNLEFIVKHSHKRLVRIKPTLDWGRFKLPDAALKSVLDTWKIVA